MGKLIDGSALYRALEKMCKNEDFDDEYEMGQRIGIRKAMTEIEHAESVDAIPIRHGKWLYRKFEVFGLEYAGNCYCSACGTDAQTDDGIEYMSRFCPNCGARMDGE